MSTIAERVAAGHAWLKANRPDRIADIDVDALDVWSIHYCPLGQTGGYGEAREQMFPGLKSDDPKVWSPACDQALVWTIDHGFNIGNEDDPYVTYDALNDEWRRVLSA